MTEFPRATCPSCDRLLAIRPGGSGGYFPAVFPRHRIPDGGGQCPASGREVRADEYMQTWGEAS